MYFLDATIAQQIVDRTMRIIKHNINVMNSQGIILGSGDKSRINTVHEGALLAISQNRAVNIDSGSLQSLQGVKAGVNLPLHYHGQIIGVVGITGEPSALGHYGELLKMTAEMMVEQANSMELEQWHKRQREEFIVQLLRQDGELPDSMLAWAKQLDIDLTLPRVAAVIELSRAPNAQTTLKDIQMLLEYPQRNNLVAMTAMDQLVILKPAFLDGKRWDPQLEDQRIEKLLVRLPADTKGRLKIALGHYFAGAGGLQRSYQTACETLKLGKQAEPEQTKYLYQQHALSVLLSGLSHDWRGQELAMPFMKLQQQDRRGVLVKTLRVYLQHFGDQQHCADALYIHRNTLRYRLEKIAEISGIDIASLDGLLQLYLGDMLSRLDN
ncbi:helix-turn-helix domain-containing protein [Shewanella avicenniae]|uniref:Helix-turn-helix domain-containing protein n=1 Tax=Shewanella avicenniae TaxID=2814294 RepID=A0ABX7QW51_9GAMM|nr:sugar diacid recognition domain-containing protein [Shewanella avicenniae]QSX34881.1 helix-turn-helix domain-containing protein [Shewanella avicenniae]